MRKCCTAKIPHLIKSGRPAPPNASLRLGGDALKPRLNAISGIEHMAARGAAVVVAGGRGLRAGGGLPKQYRPVLGRPGLRPSLAALAAHRGISRGQPVIHPHEAALFREASAGLDLLPPVNGGATRQASVRAGLEALQPHRPEFVLVHDAARPFASHALITRAIAAARASGAAVPV